MPVPVKFDDISKTANEVLADDYQTAGFQFKAKQKTSVGGAVVTSAVDLFPPKDSCMTPAKLSWRIPTPLGFPFFCIDKLEMDKGGKLKLETSTDKLYKNLKVEVKSDLADVSKITAGCTYTGVKDTQIKVDTKATKPQDFTAEVTHAAGLAMLGVKFGAANLTSPDVGVRVASGQFFGSLFLKDKFSAYTFHAFVKASNFVKCAASYEHGGKKNGDFSLGLTWDTPMGAKVKAKVQQDSSVSCSVKYSVSKGLTFLGGAKYNNKKSDFSYGLQLSIE